MYSHSRYSSYSSPGTQGKKKINYSLFWEYLLKSNNIQVNTSCATEAILRSVYIWTLSKPTCPSVGWSVVRLCEWVTNLVNYNILWNYCEITKLWNYKILKLHNCEIAKIVKYLWFIIFLNYFNHKYFTIVRLPKLWNTYD